jgi:hypothetical protein
MSHASESNFKVSFLVPFMTGSKVLRRTAGLAATIALNGPTDEKGIGVDE